MNEDIRWIQRFNHFEKAFKQLNKFIAKGELNELEKQGLIQSFEYTYKLAWITLKDYLEMQGANDIHGSRDTIRLAFRRGIIDNGETWMDMLKSRALTSRTYDETLCEEISDRIFLLYPDAFKNFSAKMKSFKEENQ